MEAVEIRTRLKFYEYQIYQLIIILKYVETDLAEGRPRPGVILDGHMLDIEGGRLRLWCTRRRNAWCGGMRCARSLWEHSFGDNRAGIFTN